MIPQGTTHVWTPAIDTPRIGFVYRRAYFKKVKTRWFSYSINKVWEETRNVPGWFIEEKKLGYLVTIKKFNSPGFVAVEEMM